MNRHPRDPEGEEVLAMCWVVTATALDRAVKSAQRMARASWVAEAEAMPRG